MDQNSSPRPRSLRSAVMAGSVWMVVMRWVIRGLGLASTMILVRLLTKEDFGVVAMGTLFISLLDVLVNFGVDAALIQRREVTREHLDTAWTLRFLQGLLVAIVIFAAAPYGAEYFDEPRVTVLMQFLSIGIVIAGFENIGVVAFRKDLKFEVEFRFRVLRKLFTVVFTVILTVVLRNYWALACGIVLGQLLGVVLSYMMHSYRPRPSLARFRDLWSFSQWMLVRNIGMYVRRNLDGFVVGRFFATGQMGVYSIAKEVAEIPTTEVVWPMARALYPGYAKLSHDPGRLGKAYVTVFSAISLFVFPAAAGLAVVAEPVVRVVLGERWMETVPVLRWMALYGGVLTLAASVQAPMMALGRMRRLATLIWFQTAVAAPVIVLAARSRDLVVIAQAQLGVTLLLLPAFLYALTSISTVRVRALLAVVWRPLVSASVMVFVLLLVGHDWTNHALVVLTANVSLAATVFVGMDLLLWRWTGKPDHAERLVVDMVNRRLRRKSPATPA